MLNWLRRRTTNDALPEYSALRADPDPGLPPELAEMEGSESFAASRNSVEGELKGPSRRPGDDKPLFTEIMMGVEGYRLVTLNAEEGPCLAVFTTPLRAADYRQFFFHADQVRFLTSTPGQIVKLLHDNSERIRSFAIDRCPRCNAYVEVKNNAPQTADNLIAPWCVHKATELARANLYSSYAFQSARAGRLETSRRLALTAVGHVSFEDPRPHFLLGQVALKLKDRKLFREAKALLEFLHLDQWQQGLARVAKSGSTQFEYPGDLT